MIWFFLPALVAALLGAFLLGKSYNKTSEEELVRRGWEMALRRVAGLKPEAARPVLVRSESVELVEVVAAPRSLELMDNQERVKRTLAQLAWKMEGRARS